MNPRPFVSSKLSYRCKNFITAILVSSRAKFFPMQDRGPAPNSIAMKSSSSWFLLAHLYGLNVSGSSKIV